MDHIDPPVPGYAAPGYDDPPLYEASVALRAHVQQSLDLYNAMIDAGIAREQARMVLPQNMYTQYYGTVSLHNAFHFLSLRLDPHAQWEIRRVAEAMLEHLQTCFPVATAAFKRVRKERAEAWRRWKEAAEAELTGAQL